MSQPPWIPAPGGDDADENAAYRGAHSSGDHDDTTTPAADDLWGGPGTPGPWSGGADQPWATSSSTDPWAGAKSSFAGPAPDDSGPAFPVPGAPAAGGPPQQAPAQQFPSAQQQFPAAGAAGPASPPPAEQPGEPAPAPWGVSGTPTPAGTPGYGPPSYGSPDGPSAGPAVGEPAYAPQVTEPPPTGFGPAGGYGGPPSEGGPQQPGRPDEPFRSVRSDAVPPSGAPGTAGQFDAGSDRQPPPQSAPDASGGPLQGAPPQGVSSLGPAPQGGQPQSGGPLQSGPLQGAPVPSAADVYTPAEAPPTPRPPQPELPDSMSDVPQYASRLAQAPLPDGGAPHPLDPGQQPGWGVPQQPPGQGGPPPAQGFPPQGAGQPGPGGAPAGWPNQGPVHAAGGTPPPPAIPRPEDLLVSSRPRTLEKPATWGWRGRLSRMSGGMYKPKPSAAEIADRQAKLNAQRGFSRPMTVVVIQPKGGAGKTPTTICVASALGVRRGGYIVGWDNNETRGTLAVRTTNDDNQRTTAWDLLGRLDEFERSEARVGDLGYYMRAQGEAQFDALVSDDNPGNMAQIGEVEFKRIHGVLQRFYRMIIIDTGNNVRSTNWQAAVDHADQIVVVSTYQRDVGYSGSWVLDHLAQTGRDELARDAITVLTASEPDPDAMVKGELIKHFGARTRAVVEVPYDSHIAEGGPIRWDELSEGSKRAWTSVAAAITQTLYERDQRQLAKAGPGR